MAKTEESGLFAFMRTTPTWLTGLSLAGVATATGADSSKVPGSRP